MTSMFQGAVSFDPYSGSLTNDQINNQELKVNKVKNFDSMFQDATLFNGAIVGWNPTKVTSMRYMFKNAVNFNQDLCNL